MASTNPAEPTTTKISLVIDVALLADVDKVAGAHHRSRAGEIREALQKHVQQSRETA